MAIKDFDTSENRDREKKAADDRQAQCDAAERPVKGDKDGGVTIKNAHATGDGSYGRNDSSLPEEDTAGEKGKNAY